MNKLFFGQTDTNFDCAELLQVFLEQFENMLKNFTFTRPNKVPTLNACTVFICVSLGAVTRVETRNPAAQCQWSHRSQWVRLGHRVQHLCGGRESEGQVSASNHFLQDFFRARGHPRYRTSPPVTHTKVELNSQKTEEPNSNLKTRATCSIFKSGALTGEWQLNKSIEKINRFRGRRWAKNDFPAEFSHFKVLTALTKWAWVCACRSGTHTEDKMISSECL